jgi:hypothetical protein
MAPVVIQVRSDQFQDSDHTPGIHILQVHSTGPPATGRFGHLLHALNHLFGGFPSTGWHCAGRHAGTIVSSPEPRQAEVYLVEFPAPWQVVAVRREDIVLSEDDADACAAAEEFANASIERREEMIEMMAQLSRDIRADLVAEHGEEMVDLLAKLPEVIDDMGTEGQRIVDGGMTVAGQFPRGLSKADLSAWIRNRFLAR